MTARVYIAAPCSDSARVRELHERLRAYGLEPTSQWANAAKGPENLDMMTEGEIRMIANSNDVDLLSSDAVLVLSREGAGGEMFAEARLAILHGIPVMWVGRRILSAYRAGVLRFESVDEAIDDVRRKLL